MRNNRLSLTTRIRNGTTIYLITFALLGQLRRHGVAGGYPDEIVIDNFKSGGVDYVLQGNRAIISGSRATIERVQGSFKTEHGDILIFSPECTFDQATGRGQSSRRIHLRSKSMTIDGIGFDVEFNEKRIFIRQNVRVRIYEKDLDLLGN